LAVTAKFHLFVYSGKYCIGKHFLEKLFPRGEPKILYASPMFIPRYRYKQSLEGAKAPVRPQKVTFSYQKGLSIGAF
jgi:hypothetical protein